MSIIDSLEFDSGNLVSGPDIIQISGNVYAIVYSGVDNDGFIVTVSIDPIGAIGAAVIDSWEFDATACSYPRILHVSGNIYTISYASSFFNVRCITVSISSEGIITASVIATSNIGGRPGISRFGFIHISGSVYAVLDGYTTTQSRLTTFTINADGTFGATIDTFTSATFYGLDQKLLHISGTIYVAVYRTATNCIVTTFDIADNGTITEPIVDSITIGAAGSFSDIIHVTGDIYVVAYTKALNNHGVLATIEISSTGLITDTVVDSVEFDTYYAYFPVLILEAANTVGIAYDRSMNDAYNTYSKMTVSNLGVITGNPSSAGVLSVDGQTLAPAAGNARALVQRAAGVLVVVYQGEATGEQDGYVKSFNPNKSVTYPINSITRGAALVHRYDVRKAIYQLEYSLGDITSIFANPYFVFPDKPTAQAQQEQELLPATEKTVRELTTTTIKKFLEAVN